MTHETVDTEFEMKAANYTTSGTIKIFVGPHLKEYFVHKKLLCATSKFFEGAVGNQNFQEGETNEVRLPDDAAEAFGILVHWMYHREVGDLEDVDVSDLTAAYILADKLMMSHRCKNRIVDAIRAQCFHRNCMINGDFLYKPQFSLLPKSSLLRQYFIDQCAHHWVSDPDATTAEDDAYSFIFDGSDIAADVIKRLHLTCVMHVAEREGGNKYIDPGSPWVRGYHEKPDHDRERYLGW